MASMNDAARAYAMTAAQRSPREQEAELFAYVSATLRRARDLGGVAVAKALADNQRLWTMVIDMLQDPANVLPPPLRASIISVGLAAQREMRKPDPNLDFLVNINENIAAGLAGRS